MKSDLLERSKQSGILLLSDCNTYVVVLEDLLYPFLVLTQQTSSVTTAKKLAINGVVDAKYVCTFFMKARMISEDLYIIPLLVVG